MYPELLKYQEIENRKDLQFINLGTGMGYYDFCYEDISIPAFNFALPQQSLQFDYKILKNYHHKCEKGCKVCIVLPYFIFCGNYIQGLERIHERYYSILPMEEVEEYCETSYEAYRKKIETDGICGKLELGRPLDGHEMEVQSRKAIENWERQLPIISCMSGQLSVKAMAEMAVTKGWLKRILEICRCCEFVPVIIVPPMSSVLLGKISREFRMSHFYDQMYEVIGDTVAVLDYSENGTYCSPELYGWPGFLVKDAAKQFTKEIVAIVGQMHA